MTTSKLRDESHSTPGADWELPPSCRVASRRPDRRFNTRESNFERVRSDLLNYCVLTSTSVRNRTAVANSIHDDVARGRGEEYSEEGWEGNADTTFQESVDLIL